jgi:hypothetical protein
MALSSRPSVFILAAGLLCAVHVGDGRAQAITATPLAPPPGAAGQPLAAPQVTPPPAQAPAQNPETAPAVPGAPTAGAPAQGATATPGQTTPGQTTPGQTTPGQATTGQATPPADGSAPPTYTPAPAVPVVWQPEGAATLQILDKVDAQANTVTVKVGASTQVGALTIAVRACDVTNKDEKQDATAFLDITDSHPDTPGFHGWMLESDPSISMLQHPIYDVRVVGCGAG